MNDSYHLLVFAALPMKFQANRSMTQLPHGCAKRLAISTLLFLLGTGCSATEPLPIPIPTPTSSPQPVVVATSKPAPTEEAELQEGVLYEDDFSNITSGWPNELEFDNYYIGYHEPSFYHVEVHEPNDSAVIVLPGESFDDLTAEAEVLVSEANTDPSGDFRYGLAVRRSGNRYYAFTISPRTQSWYVFKSTPTGLEVLEEGTDDSIQGLVEADTLRVDAQGPAFTFHINGRLVSRFSDPDYAEGEVGFVVETFDGPRAHIHYDELTIREVEAPPLQLVLYEDDFSNITSGWPNELEFDNYYIGYHEPSFYHVEVHEPNDSAVIVLPGESFDDLTAEAEVLVSEANTDPSGDFRYGLAVRRSGNRYYAFTISPRTQSWYVFKSTPTGLEVLEEGTDDSIQGLVEADTLRVDAQGPAFTFHINGRLVSRFNDPDYAEGEVGLVVETFDGPRAHIHYDDLTIREVEAPPVLCTVMVGLLNIRNGPGVDYTPPIDVLSEGTSLEPLGRNPDALWIQVWVPESGLTGWVRATSSYVFCDVPIVELQAIAPPSTSEGSTP